VRSRSAVVRLRFADELHDASDISSRVTYRHISASVLTCFCRQSFLLANNRRGTIVIFAGLSNPITQQRVRGTPSPECCETMFQRV